MASVIHWLGKRRAPSTAVDFAAALESVAYGTPEYATDEVRAMMAHHHGEVSALAYQIPGLTPNQVHALVCCIYNDTVIDIYTHAGGDWVIELNRFENTPGYCIPAYGQFLLTPERWQAVYLDLCPNAESEA